MWRNDKPRVRASEIVFDDRVSKLDTKENNGVLQKVIDKMIGTMSPLFTGVFDIPVEFNKRVTFDDTASFYNMVDFWELTSFHSEVDFYDKLRFHDDIWFYGVINFYKDVYFYGRSEFSNIAIFKENVECDRALFVKNNANINGDLIMSPGKVIRFILAGRSYRVAGFEEDNELSTGHTIYYGSDEAECIIEPKRFNRIKVKTVVAGTGTKYEEVAYLSDITGGGTDYSDVIAIDDYPGLVPTPETMGQHFGSKERPIVFRTTDLVDKERIPLLIYSHIDPTYPPEETFISTGEYTNRKFHEFENDMNGIRSIAEDAFHRTEDLQMQIADLQMRVEALEQRIP